MRHSLLIGLFALALLASTQHLKAICFNCIEQQADVNARDETGLTALMQAAQDGDIKELKALLEMGADVKLTEQYGWTALTYSIAKRDSLIAKQDSSKVKLLLDNGADVNAKDRRGITPLMWASLAGKSEIVKLLLLKGAEVNAAAKNGATALSFALAKGHDDVAQLLKKAGGVGPQADADVPQSFAPIDQVPKLIYPKNAEMVYIEAARLRRIQGSVRLRILFGTDGAIKRVKVISGLPYGLTEEVLRTALRITASPAMNDGRPIEYWVPLHFDFTIKVSNFLEGTPDNSPERVRIALAFARHRA
jgi:TonB family protein